MKNANEIFKSLNSIFDDVNYLFELKNKGAIDSPVRILRCHIEENLTVITHLYTSSKESNYLLFDSTFSFDYYLFRKKNDYANMYYDIHNKYTDDYMSRETYFDSYSHENTFLSFKDDVIEGIIDNYDYKENLAKRYKDDPEGYKEAFESDFTVYKRLIINADKIEFCGVCERDTDVNFIKNMDYFGSSTLYGIIINANKLLNWFIDYYGKPIVDLIFLYVDDNKKFFIDERNAVRNDKDNYKEAVGIMDSSSDISCILECLVNIFVLKAIDEKTKRTHFVLITIYYSKIDFLLKKK